MQILWLNRRHMRSHWFRVMHLLGRVVGCLKSQVATDLHIVCKDTRGRPLMVWAGGGKTSQNLFFPQRGLSNFFFLESASQIFFSWKVPLKIYFFLESASQNLFFPREYLSKFIFSRRRASEIIFFSISSGPTPDH